VSNPVVLIDEIDKLGSGYRGDPASALLELLDPAQNKAFLDHYLDVPVDLSQVLFVCTANSTDTIPGPLLDRMEVLRLSGYDLPEKVEIAKRYLEPRARKDCGLAPADQNDKPAGLSNQSDDDAAAAAEEEEMEEEEKAQQASSKIKIPESLHLEDSAIKSLARWYCREAGVRKLEQHIERIYRKSSLQLLQAKPEELESKDWSITEDNLDSFVGKPRFQSDKLFDSVPPAGVVMGLAWSTIGGSALYIETTSIHKNAAASDQQDSKDGEKKQTRQPGGASFSVHTTGQLGDVMKESVSLALTNAKRMIEKVDPGNDFFDVNQIHMHVPEGATPKDGPSAGITMTTALLGLALGRSVRADLAMTGEISLTGMVLPVGGIKEKVIAARRSGVTTIILPDGCRKDADELPDYLKEGLEIHFVKVYDDRHGMAEDG
jgi:Lon-like ATP-dependent protease